VKEALYFHSVRSELLPLFPVGPEPLHLGDCDLLQLPEAQEAHAGVDRAHGNHEVAHEVPPKVEIWDIVVVEQNVQ